MTSAITVCQAVLVAAVSQSLPHQATWTDGVDNPARLAVTPDRVYVADTRADRIVVFDVAGNVLNEWTEAAGPTGIAMDTSGNLYVARRDDAKVAKYDSAFVFQRFVGDGLVSFVQPTDLVVDVSSGVLYVVDSGADRVYGFDADGGLTLILGTRGGGFGQFRYPSAVAIDSPRDRILVADQDNYRVQVYNRSGVFLFKFGYRVKFLPNGTIEGWFPRTAGLAVDELGRIYVTDALMGTLRVFTTSGTEIAKLARFGVGAGDLQTPGDIALDASSQVYVANSNVGTIEVFGPLSAAATASGNPDDDAGTNQSTFDLLAGRVPQTWKRWSRGLFQFQRDAAALVTSTWDAPHMLSDTTCGRCHDVDGQPGGHLGTIYGQFALCNSCHTGAGHALGSAMRAADRVAFGGPTPNTGGRSHAWDVLAIHSGTGSAGPPAGSNMARYLSGGRIKCATCHDQHSHQAGGQYLRTSNTGGRLCKQCHTEHVGHTPFGSWQPTCDECHDMHNPASGNLSLVATNVNNRTLGVNRSVVLTARTGPNSFNDGDGTANDGLCQVCHTATSYHRHDGSGAPHNNGQDCISCHPHANGFLPMGGDCLSCHAGVQDNGDGVPAGGRRGVVTEFPAGDAHAHYGAELNSEACTVCHDQATHMDGFVDLLDPDGGPSLRFVRTSDLLNDPDISDFCARCHDADGATRMATPLNPFGNGNVPPDVAGRFAGTLQWEEQYGDFCFGTEGTLRAVNSHHDISTADQTISGAKIECLNCHGAHTASRSQPVVDPFATHTPLAGSDDEFCLACHGGGMGPLDPGFPPSVLAPIVDVGDPRWAAMGINWNVVLGGACLSSNCSSIRGIDSCEYVEGPWYVDYSWTHTAHGPNSKRNWNGYSVAPGASMNCKDCHDPHGSATATNPAGNPYLIRDVVDGTTMVDDGTRPAGFNGPPWNSLGVSRPVSVPVSGQTVGWGSTTGLCSACHAQWLTAYDFHDFCTACQTCHGHGMAWGETDWVDFNSDTPCPTVATELQRRTGLRVPHSRSTQQLSPFTPD